MTSPTSTEVNLRTIRPITASAIEGIVFQGDQLLAIDSPSGFLLQIDPKTDNTIILNPNNWQDFIGATGITIVDDVLWFTTKEGIYFTSLAEINTNQWNPQLFVRLSHPPNGIAIWEKTVYVTSQKSGKILIFNRDTGKQITYFYSPGIGVENISVQGEELWLSDNLEQTVYCLERATGKIKYSLLTPFANPTGLAFYTDSEGQKHLYVAYADDEPYIRDNPNANPAHELQYRRQTFIHPLYFKYYPEKRYALSNGYLIELHYVEEIAPLEKEELNNLEWRIALPVTTDRQKVVNIEWVGIPYIEEIDEGQKVALFKFPQLKSDQRYIFGWKALIEVWSIKYQYSPRECENLPELSQEEQQRYLIDDDELAMNTEIMQRAAIEAIGSETNILRKVYNIRNYVYDKLAYEIKPHIYTPDIALKRGLGSCGEYLGVLLAICRINGIACRTVGRYKCPPHPLKRNLPLEPDFNHVWMEFYLPGVGWLPMESNPDDLIEGGPYPSRFFMGLSWYHAEMGKGIAFEIATHNGEKVPIGNWAINHVRFTILQELSPQ